MRYNHKFMECTRRRASRKDAKKLQEMLAYLVITIVANVRVHIDSSDYAKNICKKLRHFFGYFIEQ